MLFTNFDFSSLDLPSYKEDSVREDIIAPILRKIGYSATGDVRMERSKRLIHPFVKIGSKDYPIHIVPDYTLFWKDTPLLVLEAKSPVEEVLKSRHVEQAFSYAIHPDVRAPYYGLCKKVTRVSEVTRVSGLHITHFVTFDGFVRCVALTPEGFFFNYSLGLPGRYARSSLSEHSEKHKCHRKSINCLF